MRIILISIVIITALFAGIDEPVSRNLQNAHSDEFIPVILVVDRPGLREAVAPCFDMEKQARREFAEIVISEYTRSAQRPVLELLRKMENDGKVREIHAMKMGGGIAVEAMPIAISRISRRDDIKSIIDNSPKKIIHFDSNPWVPRMHPAEPDEAMATWSVERVNADDVWALGITGSGVLVAIIDSGVRYTHYDLADHMWNNPGEVPGNSSDDDGNGYVDDYYGYDFVNGDGNPSDDNGHGTSCAGIVAGDGTAGTETGVAPDATIMAIKAINSSGSGLISQVVEGIDYAVDMGAHVLSISLGWSDPTDATKDYFRSVFEDVLSYGVIAASSAGNDGESVDPPQSISAPADGPSPSQSGASSNTAIVSVGATQNSWNWIANYSSRGPTHWDTDDYSDFPWPPGLIKPELSAPGVNISTASYYGDASYTDGFGGTSAACPSVAGAMALALSKNPALTPEGIDTLLRNSATDIGTTGHDNAWGAGLLDCYELITITPVPTYPILSIISVDIDDTTTGNGNGIFDPGETVKLIVEVRNNGMTATGVTGSATVIPDPYISTSDASAGWPNIATSSSEFNRADPFQLQADPITPPGHGAQVEIVVNSGGYTWVDTTDINVAVYARNTGDHITSTIDASISNFGIFGFFNGEGTPGQGFAYGDTNTLYSGSFFLGIGYDNVITGENGGASEFVPIQQLNEVTDGSGTTFFTGYSDPESGIMVLQRSNSFTSTANRDYVILRFIIKNRSTTTYSDLYCGFYCDFDIHSGWTGSEVVWYDRSSFDMSNERGYMWEQGGTDRFTGYVGLAGLTGITSGSVVENDVYVYPSSDGGMGWDDTVKYNFMDGSFSVSSGSVSEDWSLIVSDGPFTLLPGDEYWWAVAVVAGDNLTDWENNADAAETEYYALQVPEADFPRQAELEIYPNPFNAACRIISESSEISIYDISGRMVKQLESTSENQSKNSYIWDGRNSVGEELPAGIYFVKPSTFKVARKVLMIK